MSKEDWISVYDMLTCNECHTPPHFVGIKYELLDKLEEKLHLCDHIREDDENFLDNSLIIGAADSIEYPARATYIVKNDQGEEFFREAVINSTRELFSETIVNKGEKFVKYVSIIHESTTHF
jgi:hypothetical protein